jgi:hypothetical protein
MRRIDTAWTEILGEKEGCYSLKLNNKASLKKGQKEIWSDLLPFPLFINSFHPFFIQRNKGLIIPF